MLAVCTSRGFEAELQGIVCPVLDLTYHFGYTHALIPVVNFLQMEMPSIWKASTRYLRRISHLCWRRNITGVNQSKELSAFLRGEWFYFGKQYFDLSNLQTQSAYQLLNASVGVSYKHMSFSFWFRNITGAKYVAYAYDFGAARLGDPFTYGVTVKYVITTNGGQECG